MNPNLKKALLISGITLDVGITVFLFVVAVIMLATMPAPTADRAFIYENNPNMITYFQANPWVYLGVGVIPLVLLLIANIVVLVLYVKKAGKTKAQLSDLSEDQKAALRAEILKDMDSSEEKPEEKK